MIEKGKRFMKKGKNMKNEKKKKANQVNGFYK